jgi:uncharacterized RDD family membrane protein YckC
MPEKTDQYDQKCSMFKRLAAIFYDSLCLFSLFFLATLILIFFTKGESIASNNIAYDLFLALITYLYFVWQWVNGGQTLGMRTWHIKLKTQGLNPLSWGNATIRYCLSLLSFICFGLGFAWALFNDEKLTFHDRYSHTRLINDR